jgi:hypothetical protein
MPIRRYVEHGVFTDETLSAMGKAFTAALRSLGIGDDEIKRSAVARVIIGLAREDEDLDAASLHNRAVAAFSGAVHAVEQRDLEGASHGGGSSQKLAAALVRPEAIP